jgi:hypothetical protein
MNYSIVNFRGPAATPGIFVTLTRVNRGKDCFFNLSHTAHRKAGQSFSPLNSISYQLVSDFHTYPIKAGIDSKGWKIENCAFRMWLIGRIDQHPACAGLSFQDCTIIALILGAMIRKYLKDHGHETTGYEYSVSKDSTDARLYEIALILFEDFLRNIAPLLLEDMDLNSMNFEMDKKTDL